MKTLLFILCLLPALCFAQSVPTITNEGNRLTLGIKAEGTPPLVYQWFRGKTPIKGANAEVLVLDLRTALAGEYYCVVTNSGGKTQSASVRYATTTTASAAPLTITRKK